MACEWVAAAGRPRCPHPARRVLCALLTLVIALVLGETCERSFHLTKMISDDRVFEFILGRPVATMLLVATVLTLCLPFARKVLTNRRRTT